VQVATDPPDDISRNHMGRICTINLTVALLLYGVDVEPGNIYEITVTRKIVEKGRHDEG
jgi:hypothetical protein